MGRLVASESLGTKLMMQDQKGTEKSLQIVVSGSLKKQSDAIQMRKGMGLAGPSSDSEKVDQVLLALRSGGVD